MRITTLILKGLSLAAATLLLSSVTLAQQVTFHKDIEPILQRSCQYCHRPGGAAPMQLITYDQVAPYAGLIEYKTGLRDRMGAMPPWYAEKDIGIQHYKSDNSLTEEEIFAISAWARTGAERGDPADAPAPLVFDNTTKWSLGEPDLIFRTEDYTMPATEPDWWGDLPQIPVGLTEDRYVKSVEIVETNDVPRDGTGRETVGGLWIYHHVIWRTEVVDENGEVVPGTRAGWPVHEVGRNPDIFDPENGRLLRAGSVFMTDSAHMHSTGLETTGYLEIGFRFHPVGYEPKYETAQFSLGNGVDISATGNKASQELHAYAVLDDYTKIISFEPHLHALGERMCLEAIWGYTIETLSCVGYDHNWVRAYPFEVDYEPLLPPGTVLHITGFLDNTSSNFNVPDPRNWQGSGNRSMTNMFIDLGIRVKMTEEQFFEEMAGRAERLNLGPNDHVIGCPLCGAELVDHSVAAQGDD